MIYFTFTGNPKIDDILNHPDLDIYIDVPILYAALCKPNDIKIIPKSVYDHLLKFLEDLEEYELCAKFIKVKDKVDNRTIEDIIGCSLQR